MVSGGESIGEVFSFPRTCRYQAHALTARAIAVNLHPFVSLPFALPFMFTLAQDLGLDLSSV